MCVHLASQILSYLFPMELLHWEELYSLFLGRIASLKQYLKIFSMPAGNRYGLLELKTAFISVLPVFFPLLLNDSMLMQQCLLCSILILSISKIRADCSSVHDVSLLPTNCQHWWIDIMYWRLFSTQVVSFCYLFTAVLEHYSYLIVLNFWAY